MVVARRAAGAAHDRRHPVFLFAIDGLEWRIVAPLLAEGRLPTIERLMAGGRYGYLKSLVPTMSPAIWTSVATGKRPKKHGILGFVHDTVDEHGRHRQRYYTSAHRRTKAVWNILSDYGLSSVVIGWWMTYPAEPINGVMVSQANTTKPVEGLRRQVFKGALLEGVGGQVHPPEYEAAVLDVLDRVDQALPDITAELFGEFRHPLSPFARLLWNETQWAFRADATYARVASMLLARHPHPDLFAIYLGGTDVVAHRFWRYSFPDAYEHPPDPDALENCGRLIPDYYHWVDDVMGRLLAGQPDDVTVLVVSDHGMHAVNSDVVFTPGAARELTNSAHHKDGPPGVFIAKGRGIAPPPAAQEPRGVDPDSLEVIASVLGITPTVLALKGIPRGWDMDGHPPWGLLDRDVLLREFFHVVPSHDEPGGRAAPAAVTPIGEEEEERLEQLRALGYIE